MPPGGSRWSSSAPRCAGWVNHARYGDTLGLRRAVLGSVRLPPHQAQNLRSKSAVMSMTRRRCSPRPLISSPGCWRVTNHFPRSQRFVVTKRLLDAALDFQELLVDANARAGRARLAKLDLADAELDKVRLYLRLAFRWKWLSPGQYRHAPRM